VITSDARHTYEIKSRISMVKAAFNKQQTFHQQLGHIPKEECSQVLHLE
jgi:hypothetical protein